MSSTHHDSTESAMLGESASRLVEHFFRHESGKMIAVLARLFGLRHLDLAEDVVQSALVEALQRWKINGIPENPSAWLHTVARNKIQDALRRREVALRLAPSWARMRPASAGPDDDDLFLDSSIADSQLRMVFACCHPTLARENQIALTLKTLCGFSHGEIARGLLTSEETIKKRLQRSRQQLIAQNVELSVPIASELADRLDAVHQCLYLLFNEGYASGGPDPIRGELCSEAARLCLLLCGHEHCRVPATFALMSLMLFHAARLEARRDGEGRLLLLEEQDRTLWDRSLIEKAREFLDLSASGKQVSVYHLEAGIAWLHCSAPSFAQTKWTEILRLYDVLLLRSPSPIYRLNRAIVLAHVEGPSAGIAVLESLLQDPALERYHLAQAALGELQRRAGRFDRARAALQRAREITTSPAERELLDRRIALCQ